jgi:regulator of RNase E activity RraA
MQGLRPVYSLIAIAALVLFALPAAHASIPAASSKITSTLDLLSTVTLGGTTVKPGSYTVTADDTTVTLVSKGKTIAQAKVQWKDSAQKAQSTSVLVDGGVAKEIHFSGKTKYVEITE